MRRLKKDKKYMLRESGFRSIKSDQERGVLNNVIGHPNVNTLAASVVHLYESTVKIGVIRQLGAIRATRTFPARRSVDGPCCDSMLVSLI